MDKYKLNITYSFKLTLLCLNGYVVNGAYLFKIYSWKEIVMSINVTNYQKFSMVIFVVDGKYSRLNFE